MITPQKTSWSLRKQASILFSPVGAVYFVSEQHVG